MTDLVFSQPHATTVNLVFGGDTPAAPAVVTASVTVLLSGNVTVEATAAYDNRVTPMLDCRVATPHQTAIPAVRHTWSSWNVSVQRRGVTRLPWQTACAGAHVVDAPFSTSLSGRIDAGFSWGMGQQVARTVRAVHQAAIRHVQKSEHGWQVAVQRGRLCAMILQAGVVRRQSLASRWAEAVRQARNVTGRSGASQRYVGDMSMAMPWQVAGQAQNGLSIMPPLAPPAPVIYLRDGHLVFECPPIKGSPTHLSFGIRACYLPGGSTLIPIRKVYMVINNASLRRVDGNIQLPVFNMSLSLDVDSWAWSFSAALPGVALPDLEPSEAGAPVEVEAMINGVPYRALIERIGRERSFGKSDIRVSGRGRTALLDSPYAPTQNFANTSARTAQQLMGDVLSVNGVRMDWSLDWGLTDWLVPTGVFAHQGSYISAVNALAAAAGGYVQPHASLQTLHILPRYPTAPWAWDSVTPDFVLPSDVTTRESIEWVERARYNRVYVSGQQSGVLGRVTRAGTAGDLVAPMVTDALITSAVAARQRGLSILANTGRQAEISLRLPVLAETGVITPGKFVRYTDAGVSRLGIVRSTGVEVGMPEIWQTLGVQTYA